MHLTDAATVASIVVSAIVGATIVVIRFARIHQKIMTTTEHTKADVAHAHKKIEEVQDEHSERLMILDAARAGNHVRLDVMEKLLKEVRDDVKRLLARSSRGRDKGDEG